MSISKKFSQAVYMQRRQWVTKRKQQIGQTKNIGERQAPD